VGVQKRPRAKKKGLWEGHITPKSALGKGIAEGKWFILPRPESCKFGGGRDGSRGNY